MQSLKSRQFQGVSLEPYRLDTKWTLRKSQKFDSEFGVGRNGDSGRESRYAAGWGRNAEALRFRTRTRPRWCRIPANANSTRQSRNVLIRFMFILLTQIFWTYPYAQDSHVNWEYLKERLHVNANSRASLTRSR